MRYRASFLLTLFSIVLGLGSIPVRAHETPIAVLELRATQPGQFLARWNYSSSIVANPPTAVFPEHCTFEPPRLDCGARGLVGTLFVEKLGERYSAAVVRVTDADGKTQSFTLTAADPKLTFAANPGSGIRAILELAGAYVSLGIEHILLGVDHLLFVLGLIWLVRSPWMLVKTITSFTIAHSITLAVATLGWIGIPERPVNAAIALSIVFVGVEAVKLQRGQVSLTARQPWLVAFAFGLLHGFGFASALTDLGLTQSSIPWALLFFNVGVEIGQIGFVLLVLALSWAHRMVELRLPEWSGSLPAYAVGSIAVYWFLGRFMVILNS